MVNDALRMALEVVEKLLSYPTVERREALEDYHQRLAEMLRVTELLKQVILWMWSMNCEKR